MLMVLHGSDCPRSRRRRQKVLLPWGDEGHEHPHHPCGDDDPFTPQTHPTLPPSITAHTGCGSPKNHLGEGWSLTTPTQVEATISGRSAPKAPGAAQCSPASTSGIISGLPLLECLCPAAEGANWNKLCRDTAVFSSLACALFHPWVVDSAVDPVSWFRHNKIYSIYCK